MSYSPLSAVQPHSLSSVCICSSEVAMSYAWVALELLLFPAPCAAACAGEKKTPRSEQKGRYFLSGSATEGQQIISQIITPQCKHGHLRTYARARMFPKVRVGGSKCWFCRKVLRHVCSFVRRFDQNTKQALVKIELILSVSLPRTMHKTSFA